MAIRPALRINSSCRCDELATRIAISLLRCTRIRSQSIGPSGKIKTPTELVRALRSVLEIGGVNFKDLDRRVDELDLPMVALNAVNNANIRFLGELVRLSGPEAKRLFKTKKSI